MMRKFFLPFSQKRNKKVFLAFLKEGKKASWPVTIYTIYKHYFEYEMNQVPEYQFAEWLSNWKDSEEHIKFILKQFSEEQLIEFFENYEDWVDLHFETYNMRKKGTRFSNLIDNQELDERAKKILFCIVSELNDVLRKVKIK
ncbi:hypothetical protein [Massilibacterium senegalense]|uniref:hypothetical protein n=1 Tax=Massilibacterium senegalense TaxID=1632858 RepID=UPI0011C86DDC|nr:hypothetical protein [Massilibacterium senegalense]